MDTQIIIYQDGASQWWPWALKSLRDWCDVPVVMITQKENYVVGDNSVFVNIDEYRKCADSLREKYFSRWDSKAWFIGFERFIILAKYIEQNNIERFFSFDSDFLLFCNPIDEANKFIKYDFTLSMSCGTHDMFWNNKDVLIDFVGFINELMEREIELTVGEKTIGSFSDMHALMMFRNERKYNIGEMTDIRLGVTWDNNLKQNYHGYDYSDNMGGMKKLTWKNGQPYCINHALDMIVRFAGLHISSYLKMHIPEIYREARCSI